MYIHEIKNWPQFIWDREIIHQQLVDLRHQQGRLMGTMQGLGFSLREAALVRTLAQDVVKSSEIEGEKLDVALVRSSVARHLGLEVGGLDKKDKNIEGIVEMLLDATQNFDQPLTEKRLLLWHKMLVEGGTYRIKPVQVISGYLDREVIHFEGPKPERLNNEMKLFFDWIDRGPPLDFVLKAAIAHLWFVTIHPFDDGNGRIARAIADYFLAKSENTPERFYSQSTQIQKERKDYYDLLEKTQKGNLDITEWVSWFLGCLNRAIQSSLLLSSETLARTKIWESIKTIPLNPRQKKMIDLLLNHFEGKLTSSKWAKLNKCSQDTASRDIQDLIEKGILAKNPEGGRSTSFRLIRSVLTF